MKLPAISEVVVSELLIGTQQCPQHGHMAMSIHFRGTEALTVMLEQGGPDFEEFLINEFRTYLQKQRQSPVRPEVRAFVQKFQAEAMAGSDAPIVVSGGNA